MSNRSLAALLSQVLVAFTVEFDNEFERRMGEAGIPGARLSLVVWANLLRFVGEDGISVRELRAQAMAPDSQVKHQLGCLERWGFVALQPAKRPGWGSGRGIHADWIVSLTPKGLAAIRIWPPLFGEMEDRWEKRFGKAKMGSLREALHSVADKLNFELPHGLPGGIEQTNEFPPQTTPASKDLSLPTLLSQLLLTFQLEFDRESPVPLVICANTLRVLGENPIPASLLPHLTGLSPETSDIGWQIKPYVLVTPDPAARGKLIRLSPRGMIEQHLYYELIAKIEKRWEARFGNDTIATLRESLQRLFTPSLSEGLVPPSGTARAGDQAPALGRRDVGPAARQRMRGLVAQTKDFIRDPAGTLPHFPAWDMNRGFGP